SAWIITRDSIFKLARFTGEAVIPPCAARLGVSSRRWFVVSIVGGPVWQRALPQAEREGGLPRADCPAWAGLGDCSVRRWPDAHCGLEVVRAAWRLGGWAEGGLRRADCRARSGWGGGFVRCWGDVHVGAGCGGGFAPCWWGWGGFAWGRLSGVCWFE